MQHKQNKSVLIILARLSSSRLPGKALYRLGETTILGALIHRLKQSVGFSNKILATGPDGPNRLLYEEAKIIDSEIEPFFAESECDVLGRLASVAERWVADSYVVVTADNPYISAAFAEDVLRFHHQGKYDYTTTTHMTHCENWDLKKTVPFGITVQVVQRSALLRLSHGTNNICERENHNGFEALHKRFHHQYSILGLTQFSSITETSDPNWRLTIDYPADYRLARKVFSRLSVNFSMDQLFRFLQKEYDDSKI